VQDDRYTQDQATKFFGLQASASASYFLCLPVNTRGLRAALAESKAPQILEEAIKYRWKVLPPEQREVRPPPPPPPPPPSHHSRALPASPPAPRTRRKFLHTAGDAARWRDPSRRILRDGANARGVSRNP
jgi:hypothetical protein